MNAPRKPLMPLDEALATLLAAVEPLSRTELIDCFDAQGRVLRQDVVSALEVPPHDNSAMDGYAVRTAEGVQGGDPVAGFAVSQRIPAGSFGHTLAAGTVARIFTGAPIPEGADAVVPQEDCDAVIRPDGSTAIRLKSTATAGQWIRRQGEDIRRGQTVLHQGQRLSAAALGLAASVGLAQLQVSAKPRVALFSTGDELVMPGEIAPQDMRPGAIYNSNRFFLRALLQQLGCTVTDYGIVPDQRAATIQALADAAAGHDLVLTSGGVSVGEEDHIKPAVQALGQLDLWQIAIKPGKPFAHGKIGTAHFVGLPGNPVSSFVTFLLLVRPLLLKLQGASVLTAPVVTLTAHFDWLRPDKRREFLRVRRNAAGGLDLFPNQSSGVLTSTVWGEGLVDTAPGQVIRAGDAVSFVSFSELVA
jgi:molybdopterin molybdotransferase